MNLILVGASCFAGRLATYGLGVGLAGTAADEAGDRLRAATGPWQAALGLAAVAVSLWLLGRIDWRAAIERRRLRLREQHPQTEAEAPE